MMVRGYKKYRGYKREVQRVIRVIDNITPVYDVENNKPFCDEYYKAYPNLFFNPRKKDRREILQHFIKKTEEILKNKPDYIGFCKIVLIVYEDNFSHSEIDIFYRHIDYDTFFERTDIRYQKWTKINRRSLVEMLNIETSLNESCYLEEVNDDSGYRKNRIWFYGDI